jgi:hypothetical protein
MIRASIWKTHLAVTLPADELLDLTTRLTHSPGLIISFADVSVVLASRAKEVAEHVLTQRCTGRQALLIVELPVDASINPTLSSLGGCRSEAVECSGHIRKTV